MDCASFMGEVLNHIHFNGSTDDYLIYAEYNKLTNSLLINIRKNYTMSFVYIKYCKEILDLNGHTMLLSDLENEEYCFQKSLVIDAILTTEIITDFKTSLLNLISRMNT